jgi:hypothetical protein
MTVKSDGFISVLLLEGRQHSMQLADRDGRARYGLNDQTPFFRWAPTVF